MKTRDEILQEALEVTCSNYRCTIAATMGIGKTLLGLLTMEKELQKNGNSHFLVVIPKLVLKNTWKEESIKHKLEHVFKYVSFTTYRSLSKIELDYDIIVLDECHNLLYSHDANLSKFKNKIIGLTGTPPKVPKSEKGIMVNAYCPVKYSYITDEAIEDNILNDYKIYIHSIDLEDKEKTVEISTKKGTFTNTERNTYNYWCRRIEESEMTMNFKRLQIDRIMRMKALQTFKSKENYARILVTKINEKCLIFANTKEQADRLCSVSYYSGNPNNKINLENFITGKEKILSSVQQLKEGVNIPNLKNIIILHSYSNERQFSQKLGRILRLAKDEVASVHLLMYKNTVDEEWVANAVSDFNKEKIIYL
ncbi:MAG: hypothetical protein EOL97_08940 [Spirochaetia bacterium]|nr:hypothetical protein [Spirochaetia bacterium]